MNFDSPFIKIDFILLHDYNIYYHHDCGLVQCFAFQKLWGKMLLYYKVKLNNKGDLNTHAIYSAKILPLLNPC